MKALALALAVFAPAAAMAQTPEICARLVIGLGATTAVAAEWQNGECVLRSLVWDAPDGDGTLFAADEIRLRALGLEHLAEVSEPPTELMAELDGFRVLRTTGHRLVDWAHAAQAEGGGWSGRIVAFWDQDARELHILHLRLDMPGEDALSLFGRMADVDLSSWGALWASLPSARVVSFGTDVTFDGGSEDLLLGPLAEALMGDAADPEALRRRARVILADAPDRLFSGTGRSGLDAFLADLSRPRGTLGLYPEIEAPGLKVARLHQWWDEGFRTPAEAWQAFEGHAVAAGWAPSPG